MKAQRTIQALVLLLAMTSVATAAKLVVISVDSGTGATPGTQPPVDPLGANGFLIGIDNSSDPLQPLAVQNLTFSGPGFVQRLAPKSVLDGNLVSPNVQLRSEALLANASDSVAGSTFGGNDSWWWDQVQNGLTLSPVATGIQGGLPGGPMTMTGTFNISGAVPGDVWRTAYIVATGDVTISVLIASGQHGFDPLGNPSQTGGTALLSYGTASIVPVPEPSSFVLAALGLIGLAAWGWRWKR